MSVILHMGADFASSERSQSKIIGFQSLKILPQQGDLEPISPTWSIILPPLEGDPMLWLPSVCRASFGVYQNICFWAWMLVGQRTCHTGDCSTSILMVLFWKFGHIPYPDYQMRPFGYDHYLIILLKLVHCSESIDRFCKCHGSSQW